MPNIKSAEKRVSIARARNAKNKAIRSEMKTTIKNLILPFWRQPRSG
jgi:small subunit ribosomal protein S20